MYSTASVKVFPEPAEALYTKSSMWFRFVGKDNANREQNKMNGFIFYAEVQLIFALGQRKLNYLCGSVVGYLVQTRNECSVPNVSLSAGSALRQYCCPCPVLYFVFLRKKRSFSRYAVLFYMYMFHCFTCTCKTTSYTEVLYVTLRIGGVSIPEKEIDGNADPFR